MNSRLNCSTCFFFDDTKVSCPPSPRNEETGSCRFRIVNCRMRGAECGGGFNNKSGERGRWVVFRFLYLVFKLTHIFLVQNSILNPFRFGPNQCLQAIQKKMDG